LCKLPGVCLLVLAWRIHPRYRLIVAANRDEFHDRPSAALTKWPPAEGAAAAGILAGKDLQAGGTWLALDAARRFGVVTNYRDLQRSAPGAPSRGELIPRYLSQGKRARGFLEALQPNAARYAGFNLLLSDADALWYASNRASPFARELPPGVYGLSNHLLDTPWPKLARVRQAFRAWLDAKPERDPAQLLDMLADRSPAAAHESLPQTGLPPEWERVLSSPFVLHPDYGTRCSTILTLEPSGAFRLHERRFERSGAVSGDTELAAAAGEWP
jgi:uncharacterized protein with NRDE domain